MFEKNSAGMTYLKSDDDETSTTWFGMNMNSEGTADYLISEPYLIVLSGGDLAVCFFGVFVMVLPISLRGFLEVVKWGIFRRC